MPIKKEWGTALKLSIPVMAGYLFLGIAFGLVAHQAGFGWPWVLFMSLYVYAGSLQFLLVPLMAAGASLGETAMLALMVNIRHLFYGLTFLESFRSFGPLKPYMIHSLTDETYSLLATLELSEGVDKNRVMFLISALNQSYWVGGTVTGAILGQAIPWDLAGIDFAMTALFTVIFTDQWLRTTNHWPALAGIACGLVFLLLIGPAGFLPPALVATVGCLLLLRKRGLIHE